MSGEMSYSSDGPDVAEVENQRDEALAVKAEGGSRYPAATYEEGVESALAWVLGERDEPPMED